MASQQTSVVAFSSNGEYFACSSADGVVKLWQTSTGNLVQEFSPSKHLTATCTCLRWGPGRHMQSVWDLVNSELVARLKRTDLCRLYFIYILRKKQ